MRSFSDRGPRRPVRARRFSRTGTRQECETCHISLRARSALECPGRDAEDIAAVLAAEKTVLLERVHGASHGFACGADHLREQFVRDRQLQDDAVASDSPMILGQLEQLLP